MNSAIPADSGHMCEICVHVRGMHSEIGLLGPSVPTCVGYLCTAHFGVSAGSVCISKTTKGGAMIILRSVIGDELRRQRLEQGRTLREVSAQARVSLGYLSEVERGQKEASSELLAAICGALDVPLSRVLESVSTELADREARTTKPLDRVPAA